MLEKASLKRTLAASLPLLFWSLLLVVTYLMLIELPPKHGGWPYWDKVQHLLVFIMLTSMAFLAYQKVIWLSAILLMLYGAAIELLQGLLTVTRMPSVGDWLADVAGVVLTLILTTWFARLLPRKAKI